MESEISLKEKGGNYDVVVEIQVPGSDETPRDRAGIQENGASESRDESSSSELSRVQMNLFTTTPAQITVPSPSSNPATTSTPAQIIIPIPSPARTPNPSAKPPIGPSLRQRSSFSKPKSRILEPSYPNASKPVDEIPQTAPPKSPFRNVTSPSAKVTSTTPKTSAPITPRTPLMASVGGEDDDDDDDDEVYKTENVKLSEKKRGKKVKVMVFIEWILFVCLTAFLILSLTFNKLRNRQIWSLELWKWCVQVLVIFCGRLFTEWFTNSVVFLIEKNFLLKKKVLYFLFGLKKSFRIVMWLALILLAWCLLIDRGVTRSEQASRVLNKITRGIVGLLVGAVMWMGKSLFIKIVASKFHVRTYFDRIQESIFHQYILQALSGTPMLENAPGGESAKGSGRLSFNTSEKGKEEKKEEVINVDKLYKIKREKVSAWTMGGLIKVVRNSGLPSISEVLDDSVEEERGELRVITSEVEARDAANRIFRNVAKPGHKYIEEDDLLLFMPKEEVDNAIPLFEGAAESRKIKKSAFRNWVVKAYNERKCLAVSLKDAKTAIEELNKISSGLILIVIIIVWLLVTEIATTRILVFISSQMLLLVFMFGNTAKTVFEAIIFVFIMHPFDVGDRCVVDGVQMVVDEMNILTTIFLKADNEKIYYPNSVLATRAISNFNRSPEQGDSVEFAIDFSTSVESIAAMQAKIKAYLESKPQHWSPNHSVRVKEIVDVNKMMMALYVTHTINFQNSGERGNRRSDLVLELKKIFEELGIKYRLLPQEVHLSYVGMPATPSSTNFAWR